MEVRVEKKDGSLEGFDRSKVSTSVSKAGATPEQTGSIVAQIESWVQTTAVDGVIKSSEIRSKILELLRLVNPEAATRFEAYKK